MNLHYFRNSDSIYALPFGLIFLLTLPLLFWNTEKKTYTLMNNGVVTNATAISKVTDDTPFGWAPPQMTTLNTYTVKYRTNDGSGKELQSTIKETGTNTHLEKMKLPSAVNIMYDKNHPEKADLAVEVPKNILDYLSSRIYLVVFQVVFMIIAFFAFRHVYMDYKEWHDV